MVRLDGARFGGAAAREPHRHDYHELIWIRDGRGQHAIDGDTVPVRPGTVTVIGRGQVHVFERGEALDGAVVRFSEETLADPGARRGTPAWLLAGRGGRTVAVPPGERDRLDALIDALGAELARPPTSTAPSSSATCCRRSCCGSSAGTTPRAPSAARPTTPRSSSTGASPGGWRTTTRPITTPPITPTRSPSPSRR